MISRIFVKAAYLVAHLKKKENMMAPTWLLLNCYIKTTTSTYDWTYTTILGKMHAYDEVRAKREKEWRRVIEFLLASIYHDHTHTQISHDYSVEQKKKFQNNSFPK